MRKITEDEKSAIERLAIRVPELAATLGVSLAQAYVMVNRGEVRSVRSGRAILIPRKAVQEFLDGEAV